MYHDDNQGFMMPGDNAPGSYWAIKDAYMAPYIDYKISHDGCAGFRKNNLTSWLSCYGYNYDQLGNKNIMFKINKVTSPSETIAYMDGHKVTYWPMIAYWSTDHMNGSLSNVAHDDKTNACFVDGHVKTMHTRILLGTTSVAHPAYYFARDKSVALPQP